MAANEIRDEKLDFWIEAGFNVLFIGRHGCGKSTRIFDAFNRAGLRWQYFSAPTLDPWVDFVGVPREATDEKGGYIDLILPKKLRDDELDGIFIDELNRAHPKVQNAVFELVQFRSINGRKFKNLRVLWASINPEDDGQYKVEKLDPALKDRFHVWCDVPYAPKVEWFVEHYGERLGTGVCAWWQELNEEIKLVVTPRRLQYVLDMYKANGDVRDVLPAGCNVSKLLSCLATGPINDKLREYFTSRNAAEARRFLGIENNYASALKHLQSPQEFRAPAPDWFGFFLPLLPSEKLSALMATCEAACDFVIDRPDLGRFSETIENILAANQNRGLVRKIKKKLGSTNTLAGRYGKLHNLHSEPIYHSEKTDVDWDARVAALVIMPMDTTPQRMKVYAEVVKNIPEALSAEQALATLELLGMITGRCWPQSVKEMRHLMGVVNHCLNRVNKMTGMGWVEMLSKHPSKLERLVASITKADMEKKLLCPLPLPKSEAPT